MVKSDALDRGGKLVLGSSGQRVTNQRALLLEIIRESREHLDADALYHLAREKEPRLSLSTVYRTLRLFKQLGLVDELHFDEEHHHYEVKAPNEHYHIVCPGCGKIVEFESPLIRQIKDEVGRQHGIEVTHATIDLSGYCSNCKKAQ